MQLFHLVFEIFFHQHFLCSRGQKRRSCQHFSRHNKSFPDKALPLEITDTSGGWEALASCTAAFCLSIYLLTPSSRISYLLSVFVLH